MIISEEMVSNWNKLILVEDFGHRVRKIIITLHYINPLFYFYSLKIYEFSILFPEDYP